MPLSGPISHAAGSPGNKDLVQAYQPILIATITFTDATATTPATVLRLSTHPLNAAEGGFQYNGNDYFARLLDQNIDAVQAMSATGIDIPPTMSLKIADADRFIWTNYELPLGFKGAELDIDLILWEANTGNFSADSYRKFTGICNSPSLDDSTLTVSATSKLNMQKVLLPLIPVQTRCPWVFPPDLASRQSGFSDADSKFFPCGYSPDVAGGFGNTSTPNRADATGVPGTLTDANGVYLQCDYTKAGCILRGMFTADQNGTQTGHFGGVEWDPPLWWKGRAYVSGNTTSGINAPNDQRYSDYVPLVYGQVFVNGVVLNVVGDANSTRMEVVICFGDVGGANYALVQNSNPLISAKATGGVRMVIVSGVLIPYNYSQVGGPNPADVLFRWNYVNTGNRTSGPNTDAGYDGQGDPYGNLAVIEIVVPTVLVQSQTVPSVQILTVGPAIRVWFADGSGTLTDSNVPGFTYSLSSVGATTYQGNPIWILMDLLVRANWSYSELNIDSFIKAANVCDGQINYTDNAGFLGNINVDGSPHLRYSCSLQVSQRRTAADIIQGVRNCCKAMLVPNDKSGLLQVFIKQTMADQQPSPISGSNTADPVASINAAGEASSGYSAFDFDESSILVNSNDVSTLKITQRTVVDSPNSISSNFQDQDNQFVVDSMTELDPVDVARAGQTVIGGVQIDGLNSFDQGQRVFETRFAETFRGNPRGDSGGTLIFQFETTQKIAHLQVGNICRFSHQQLNLELQMVRVISIKPSRDFETAAIALQWHEDRWYTDTYGQIGNPIYAGNNKQQLPRPPFAWQPFEEEPLSSDPIFDTTNYTFGLAQIYTVAADGTAIATLQVSGALPVNGFATLQAPLIALQGTVTGGGGTIPGNIVVYAVICPFDSNTPPKLATPEVYPCTIAVPSGPSTFSIAIPIGSWPPGSSGYQVFAGTSQSVMTFQASGTGTPSSIALTSLNTREYGPPDVNFDHMLTRVKMQLHGGVWGKKVSGVTSNTIQFAGANWSVNQWEGYDLTITGRAGDSNSLPVWNFRIASNTPDTLTVAMGTPDLTTLRANSGGVAGVQPGDAGVMRARPDTVSDTIIGDSNFVNQTYAGDPDLTSGLEPNEGPGVIRIFAGTGAGQWRNVVSNTATAYTVDQPFNPAPDATSRFWVEESTWHPGVESSQLQNSDPARLYVGNVPIENYAEESIVVQVLTMDASENASLEQYAPIRDFFIFGSDIVAATSLATVDQWQPFQVQASAADALFPNEWTFDLQQGYDTLADGITSLAELIATGKFTVTSYIEGADKPTIGNVSQSTSGGSLAGGVTYLVALCAIDANNNCTPPSDVIQVSIPAGSSSNYFTLNEIVWPSGSLVNGVVFVTDLDHADLLCAQQMVALSATSVAIGGPLVRTSWALPNSDIAKVRLKWKRLLHGGVQGSQVDTVSGTTVVCGESVDPAGTDNWTGRKLICIGRDDGTSGPFIAFNIIAFDPSSGTFTLDRSAGPGDPTQCLQPGDAIVVSIQPQDNTSNPFVVTDPGLANAQDFTAHAGLVPHLEKGYILRVIAGKSRGLYANILDNDATSYTLDAAIPVDGTSAVIIEEKAWQGSVDTSDLNNVDYLFTGNLSLPTANFQDESILVGGFNVDTNGDEALDEDVPLRMLFVYGQPGSFRETDKATFGLDDDLVNDPSVPGGKVGKYGNVHFAGQPFIGSVSCVNPPTIGSMILDVLFSDDQGVTWTSVFPSGDSNKIVYSTGATGLEFLLSFANVQLAVGNILRIDSLQSGGATGIEVVIKWGVPLGGGQASGSSPDQSAFVPAVM